MEHFKLSWNLLIWSIVCGVILSFLYYMLLWYCVNKLPQIKRKGLFLFISSVFRLTLFVIVAFLLAARHPALLLCMFVSFVITRFFIVKKKGVIC